MYEAKIIADSVSQVGNRITTFQLKYPRYIHAELMTHRVFSRNASSSRAIPVNKLVERSLAEMVTPIRWGKNQSGMQAAMEDLQGDELIEAKAIWEEMARFCATGVKRLAELGLHKQWANRPLEWFGNISVVVTSTEWDNWYELRNHTDAMPEIHHLAGLMSVIHADSTPVYRRGDPYDPNNWHLPYIQEEERLLTFEGRETALVLAAASSARCARTSYLTHDGENPIIEKDLGLFDRLVGSRPLHASPTEHQACPAIGLKIKNFDGWYQYRHHVEQTVWNNRTEELFTRVQ